MTDHASIHPDPRLDLLADRALCGLSSEEAQTLATLEPNGEDDWGFDLAVAALNEAMFGLEDEPLPAAIQERVNDEATRWMASSTGLAVAPKLIATTTTSDLAASGSTDLARASDVIGSVSPGSWTNNLPWLLVAASLLLALFAWWPGGGPDPDDRRMAMLQSGEARPIAWAENDLGIEGDVVWNDASQEGYMRFVGLEANDPTVEQYQLWIFDKERDARYPVDGGVFDVTTTDGEVLVPIDSKIRVDEATLFAITIEPPGGVVVSDRTRLILAAPVGD